MNVKDMRDRLREIVDVVPRSNVDMVALFNEKFPDEAQPIEEPFVSVKEDEEIWTYVGAGHTPPQIIRFMGIQVFKRGEATKVTNPRVLSKIKTNPSFVKGDVNGEMIMRQDQVEDTAYEKKVRENEIVQSNAVRLFSGKAAR